MAQAKEDLMLSTPHTYAELVAQLFPIGLSVQAAGDVLVLPIMTPDGPRGLAMTIDRPFPFTVRTTGDASITAAVRTLGLDDAGFVLSEHGCGWDAENEIVHASEPVQLQSSVPLAVVRIQQVCAALLWAAHQVDTERAGQEAAPSARQEREARRHARQWAAHTLDALTDAMVGDPVHNGKDRSLISDALRRLRWNLVRPDGVLENLIDDYVRRRAQGLDVCATCERPMRGHGAPCSPRVSGLTAEDVKSAVELWTEGDSEHGYHTDWSTIAAHLNDVLEERQTTNAVQS